MNHLPRSAFPAVAAAAGAVLCAFGLILSLVIGVPAPVSAQADATPTIDILRSGAYTPTPAPLAVAYAEAEGAELGKVPAPAGFTYQDSRHPGWAGVDWNGQVVWFPVDGDTSALRDLAPPAVVPTAGPALAQQQSAPAQPIACFDRAELHNGRNVIVVCAPSPEERDRLWNERAAAADAMDAQPQPMTEAERAEGERRSYQALMENINARQQQGNQTNVDEHPYVANDCNWHPPMVVGTCD